MLSKYWAINLGISAIMGCALSAWARDLKITVPERSHLTPVQRLNREGVEALQKHHNEKAEQLFYRAYLLDPDDPFTLNNLGYISELQGQMERAAQFYALSHTQTTEAVIDQTTSKSIQGRSVKEALAIPASLEINHENVEAVRLLSQGRAPEADLLLQQVAKSHPGDIFTLNNMGVAKEMEGESQQALKYYDAASATNSAASAVVTVDRSWRGKPVAQIALRNAQTLRKRLASENTLGAQVAELNLRGVSAINRNDPRTAEEDFRQAYKLDPNNAFARNNIGYLSEIQGDRETAQVFYDSAAQAAGTRANVGLATRQSAEGQKLSQVAADNDTQVDKKVAQEQEARRRQPEPIVLRRRDNTVVDESAPSTVPPTAQPSQRPQ
jgi:Flp pilus assembly protein TadD